MTPICELIGPDRSQVLPLLEGAPPNYLDVVARAVIAGNSPGHVWVDDPTAPTSAFIIDKGSCYYLAGAANNGTFNAALTRMIKEELAPQARAAASHGFKLYYSSPLWEDKITQIFSSAELRRRERSMFEIYPARVEAAAMDQRLPSGAGVRRIDASLLSRADLANMDRLLDEIHTTWASSADFVAKGFGYCVLLESSVACWCTGEYPVDGRIGIGIETVEEYRQRGYARAAATAFVLHSAANGATAIWDAWSSNIPSIVLAERLGFQRVADYNAFVGLFL
ncbi:MAG: GNAT family N-acetyltransferase [Chloroflexota bacterium]